MPPTLLQPVRSVSRVRGTLAATDLAGPTQGGGTVFGGESQATLRREYTVPPSDGDGVRVYMPGGWWTGSATGDIPSTNPFDTKVAVEYDGDTYPVTFGGARLVTIAPGVWAVESDIVADLGFVAGAPYNVRVFVDVDDAANKYVASMVYGDTYTLGADVVDGTGALASGAGESTLCMPFAITYEPDGPVKQVVRNGDSISTIANDWLRLALGDDYALLTLACGGESSAGYLTAGHNKYRVPLSVRNAVFIDAYGVNDLGVGGPSPPSAAVVGQNHVDLWNLMRRSGATAVYTITVNPRTEGDLTTTAGQTLSLPLCEPNRLDYNEWVRAGSPVSASGNVYVPVGTPGAIFAGDAGHPATDFLEIAEPVTAMNGGDEVWKANFSPEGVHPNPTGMTAQATVPIPF